MKGRVTGSLLGLLLFLAQVFIPRATPAAANSGIAWAWGLNDSGQLGDGTTNNFRALPVRVGSLTGVIRIEGGEQHSLALRADGTVWAWGQNGFGQLGDGTTTGRSTPTQVTGLTNVTAIAGDYYHSLALRSDGTAWAWGYNDEGQLGDGTTTNRLLPVQVSGLTDVMAIAGGYHHSLALRSDGTVWAWGENFYGQLGDGTTTNRLLPVQVSGLTGVTAISEGAWHSLALLSDGTVRSWGYNNYGQLGDGTTTKRLVPVQVSGLTSVTAIVGGGGHSLALGSDGTAWAWGHNDLGQLGDGTGINRLTPVQVAGLTDATAIAAGEAHSLALRSDGIVEAWGYNSQGQLGDGTTTKRLVPVQVSGLTGVTVIAAGGEHSLAANPKPDSTAPIVTGLNIERRETNQPFYFTLVGTADDSGTGGSNIWKAVWHWQHDPLSDGEQEPEHEFIVCPTTCASKVPIAFEISALEAEPNRLNRLHVSIYDVAGNRWVGSIDKMMPRVPLYIALGDSYPAGYNAPATDLAPNIKDSQYGYPRYLHERLDNLSGESAWAFLYNNMAHSGDGTGMVLASYAQVAAQELKQRLGSWNVVTITAGANDTTWEANLIVWAETPIASDCPEPPVVPTAYISRNISEMVKELRSADPNVLILVTGYPNPYAGVHACFPMAQDAVTTINNAIASGVTSAQVGAVWVDYYSRFESEGSSGVEHHPWMQNVGFGWPHPNEAGHAAIAEEIFAKI